MIYCRSVLTKTRTRLPLPSNTQWLLSRFHNALDVFLKGHISKQTVSNMLQKMSVTHNIYQWLCTHCEHRPVSYYCFCHTLFFNVLNDWMHFNLATVLLQHIHMWIAWNAWSTERSGFLNKPVPLSVTVSRFPLESFPLGFGDVWAEATMLYCRWSQLLLLSAVFLCSEGGKGCAFLAENRTTGLG